MNKQIKMEFFNPSSGDIRSYRHVMLQHGRGIDSDGFYIYQQDGEGFFGNILKSVLPILGRTIKGIGAIAKPHLKKAAADIVTAGSKRLLSQVSGEIVNTIDKPRNKRRRRHL